jgi:hypothetical protein
MAKMDAVALLKADHRKVEDLFEQFEKSRSDDKKKSLADQVCLELTVHATIEEEIFYPACDDKVEEDMMQEARVEHDAAKMLIMEIQAGSPGDPFYDAKVKVLSEMIKHHVKEEEMRSEGMFAQAKEGGLDMDDLGAQMSERKQELLAQAKEGDLPPPKMNALGGAGARPASASR